MAMFRAAVLSALLESSDRIHSKPYALPVTDIRTFAVEMLSQTVLFSLVFCVTVFADKNADEVDMKNETGEGHFWPPGGGWGPGFFPGLPPPLAGLFPPGLPPKPPLMMSPLHHHMFPPFFFDRFYCSVHASFVLVDLQDDAPHDRPTGAGFDGPPVGLNGGHPHAHIARQFCRFTAAVSGVACMRCCRIAARHQGTFVNEVTGILFVFDPTRPLVDFDTGTYHRKKREPQRSEFRSGPDGFPPQQPHAPLPHTPMDERLLLPVDGRVTQCVCCAPRKQWGFY
uniref:Uncharacterized protein n=2 Tax=Parascaris univalens TaxID=6257 RepID=A0A914ZFM9_PARUN